MIIAWSIRGAIRWLKRMSQEDRTKALALYSLFARSNGNSSKWEHFSKNQGIVQKGMWNGCFEHQNVKKHAKWDFRRNFLTLCH